MSRSIALALAGWLAAGETRMGEVIIKNLAQAGGYEVRHYLDVEMAEGALALHTSAEEAREIALYDANGAYRPLKTAPTLRRGWRITVADLEALEAALDGLYPAMLGARAAWRQRRLAITPLREKIDRQSGMYAITKKITNEQADALAGSFCNSETGCLKSILWPISAGLPVRSLPSGKFESEPGGGCIPMLCAEPCNLLVARAREVVKGIHASPTLPQP